VAPRTEKKNSNRARTFDEAEDFSTRFRRIKSHQLFRLIVTTYPVKEDVFPVSILQGSVKVAIESPVGLRASVNRTLRTMPKFTVGIDASSTPGRDEEAVLTTSGAAYRRVTLALCVFHALLLQRQQMRPMGCNIAYAFSDSDLATAQSTLAKLWAVARVPTAENLKEAVPWASLWYLLGNITYGGRVIDEQDRQVAYLLLQRSLRPQLLESAGLNLGPLTAKRDLVLPGRFLDTDPAQAEPDSPVANASLAFDSRRLSTQSSRELKQEELKSEAELALEAAARTLARPGTAGQWKADVEAFASTIPEVEAAPVLGMAPVAVHLKDERVGTRLLYGLRALPSLDVFDETARKADVGVDFAELQTVIDTCVKLIPKEIPKSVDIPDTLEEAVRQAALKKASDNAGGGEGFASNKRRMGVMLANTSQGRGGMKNGKNTRNVGSPQAGSQQNSRPPSASQQRSELQTLLEGGQKVPNLRYKEAPLESFLLREVDQAQNLLTRCHNDLGLLALSMKGDVLCSARIDAMMASLARYEVPGDWRVDHSGRMLMPWINMLRQRINFFTTWQGSHRAPASFFLPGIRSPLAFFTGVKQRHSRAHRIPISEVVFQHDVTVFKQPSEVTSVPDAGVYIHGLWLEGGKWDHRRRVVDASLEAHCPMPLIHFNPAAKSESVRRPSKQRTSKDGNETRIGRFACPLYLTAERAGEVSTSGSSSNFIFTVGLPVEDPNAWTLSGTALLCSLTDDS
jgi:hypothetical protein